MFDDEWEDLFDRSLGGFEVFGSLIEDVFSWFCWWRH
jgi:hypothetical protein